jgi:hypothetical protein
MRGLTPTERVLMESIDEGAIVSAHTAGTMYSTAECIVFERLRMLGRIEPYTCEYCGCSHPRLTAAGKEALRLNRLAV